MLNKRHTIALAEKSHKFTAALCWRARYLTLTRTSSWRRALRPHYSLVTLQRALPPTRSILLISLFKNPRHQVARSLLANGSMSNEQLRAFFSGAHWSNTSSNNDPCAFHASLTASHLSQRAHLSGSPLHHSRCRKRPRPASDKSFFFHIKVTIRACDSPNSQKPHNPPANHPENADFPVPSTSPDPIDSISSGSQSLEPPSMSDESLITSPNAMTPTDSSTRESSHIVEASAQVVASEQKTKKDAKKSFAVGVIMWAWHAFRKACAPGGFFWGVATGLAISVAVFFFPGPLGNAESLLREKVTLFDFILHDINSSYVDKVDVNRLFETGVNSMLGTLDPYTQFENNSQALEMSVKTNGKYAGVGLVISLGDGSSKGKEKSIIVVSAFEGYAFDAGIRPGDVIETVADTAVAGNSLEKVSDMLRGEPGTTVDVAVRREGFPEPLVFSLSRRSVHIKDVPAATLVGQKDDGIAYIRLQSFAKDAAAEVRDAIQHLSSGLEGDSPSASPLRGVVLDLRGNPGGLLNSAIEVAELFLPKDSLIVSTKGRGLESGPAFASSQDPILAPDIPIAVLVDGQTASASEIVAGALQDLDYGVIVGSRTFGKGLVQNVQELPFNTALKYTVGKYYTPSGRCIQALNYEQSDGEGPSEARKVEESQRKEFTTRLGRTVRDGGGIEPDVEVQSRPSFLEVALERQNMYFRFVTRYGAETKLQILPDDFVVTNTLYRDFVKYVSSSGFRYESSLDQAFDQLTDMFEDGGYDTARGKVADLKKVTESEMRADFKRHEKEIRHQLESAIRYRFQPDSQRIVAELKNDDQLARAVTILKDKKEYDKLLSAETGTSPVATIGSADSVRKS